jgi:hypothetical protein
MKFDLIIFNVVSYSSIGMHDEKPSHYGQIDNGSYNGAPQAPSDAGSDTKKSSRSFFRSAVPNSQQLLRPILSHRMVLIFILILMQLLKVRFEQCFIKFYMMKLVLYSMIFNN